MSIGIISHVVSETGLSRPSLARVAQSAGHRYKIYNIPKKNGGLRLVAQPAREVKAIQRAVVRFLLPLLPVHESSTAYVAGARLIDNADPHAGCRFILKFDFESFFPSIDDLAIRAMLQGMLGQKISEAEINFVVSCCLWRAPAARRPGLCIGAPSSPFLSNAVMFEIDHGIDAECKALGVVYTRFSDDVTFSSDDPSKLATIEAAFRHACTSAPYPRLRINERKRIFASRGSAMRVTGLTLTNQGGVSVGRSRKRGVRAAVFDFVNGRLDEAQIAKLRGELAFVLSIEPDFRDVLLHTYGPAALRVLPRIR